MDLLVLAAGMGSRFGGLKQIQPVDEKGNFIIDYSIYDAYKAGFDRVVFLIKEDMKEEVEMTVGKRVSRYMEVAYAYQTMDKLPKGYEIPKNRTKPLGTAQAIYCAKDVLKGNFAIINADDFYGADAYKQAANYLKSIGNDVKGVHANVAYMAKNTLSDKGSVKRGVLDFDENGNLKDVCESNLEWRGNEIYAAPLGNKDFKKIDLDTLVSMNLFVYTNDILDGIEKHFPDFLEKNKDRLDTAEYLTSDLMTELLENGEAVCKILRTDSVWYGVTYKDDLPNVVSALRELVKKGEYPSDMF